VVASRTPSYRGKIDTIDNDTINGIVNGNKMNVNDRILFTGTADGWTKDRVYRWTGEVWEMLEPPDEEHRQNAFYYLEANGDVTDGAPEAVFSLAQVRSLVASSIFATLIGAKEIIINQDGFIKSYNYAEEVSGFKVNAEGQVEFNNGKFRGELEVGALSILKTNPISMDLYFPNNTTAETIFNAMSREEGIFDITGTYNGITASKIETKYIYESVLNPGIGILPSYHARYTTEIYITTNTRQLIARTISEPLGNISNTTHPVLTTSVLNIKLTTLGKTLKLTGLPVAPLIPSDPNTVYLQSDSQGNYNVKVKA